MLPPKTAQEIIIKASQLSASTVLSRLQTHRRITQTGKLNGFFFLKLRVRLGHMLNIYESSRRQMDRQTGGHNQTHGCLKAHCSLMTG